jgi:hypothetical protein
VQAVRLVARSRAAGLHVRWLAAVRPLPIDRR